MSALVQINKRLLKAVSHDCQRVTLDIDATVINAHKKAATYNTADSQDAVRLCSAAVSFAESVGVAVSPPR